jgi:triosephosphate isomerase
MQIWQVGIDGTTIVHRPQEVHGCLRGLLSELASKEIAQAVRILYGGSVKADNAGDLCREPEIDGALVGGASLQAQAFLGIVRKAAARGGAHPKE